MSTATDTIGGSATTAAALQTSEKSGSWFGPPRPNAIATLLTSDDFLPGAQTLLYSLQKSLSIPSNDGDHYYYPPELVVLTTPAVSSRTRSALYPHFCTRIIEVEHIPFPSSSSSSRKDDDDDNNNNNNTTADNKSGESHVKAWNTNCGLTKFHIFRLDVYDLLLYIDADCLVLKDVGHLFALANEKRMQQQRSSHAKISNGDDVTSPSSSSLLGAAPDIFPPDKFNGGVLLIRPSVPIFRDLLSQCATTMTLQSYDGGDTGFLNAYFSHWYQNGSDTRGESSSSSSAVAVIRLPFAYNAQRFLYKCTHAKQPKYWDVGVGKDELVIVHYSSSPKPWEAKMKQSKGRRGNGAGTFKTDDDTAERLLDQTDKRVVTKSTEIKMDALDEMWISWYEQSQEYATSATAAAAAAAEMKRRKKHKEKQSKQENSEPIGWARPCTDHFMKRTRPNSTEDTGRFVGGSLHIDNHQGPIDLITLMLSYVNVTRNYVKGE